MSSIIPHWPAHSLHFLPSQGPYMGTGLQPVRNWAPQQEVSVGQWVKLHLSLPMAHMTAGTVPTHYPTPQAGETLSPVKLVPGAKKVGTPVPINKTLLGKPISWRRCFLDHLIYVCPLERRRAVEQWSPCTTTPELVLQSLGAAEACTLEPVLCSKRSHCNEKPTPCNGRVAPALCN